MIITRAVVSVVLAVLVAGLAWWLGGRIWLAGSLLLVSPLIAFGIAPLLIESVGGSVALIRRIAYRDLSGRHVAYKGRSLDVREDLSGDRWIRVSDVRKVLPSFPRDGVLQRSMPQALGLLHPPKTLRISAPALNDYLARNEDAAALRFRVWLQRELIYPAERARERGFAGQVRYDPAPATDGALPAPALTVVPATATAEASEAAPSKAPISPDPSPAADR